jgi:hypothetical protein
MRRWAEYPFGGISRQDDKDENREQRQCDQPGTQRGDTVTMVPGGRAGVRLRGGRRTRSKRMRSHQMPFTRRSVSLQ